MRLKKILIAAFLSAAIFILIPKSVSAAPQTMPDGGIFDAEYYAAMNPDVTAIYGTDANVLYAHYLNYGSKEGRLPYDPAYASVTAIVMPDGFDAAYYAASYPDIAAVYGTDPQTLYSHYKNYGKNEGRYPNAAVAQQAQLAAQQAAAQQAQLAAQQKAAQDAQDAQLAAQQNQQKSTGGKGRTVYWTEKGKCYHSTKSCRTLSRSKVICSGSIDDCPKDDPCDVCN